MGDSYYQEHKEISIHALREEGDVQGVINLVQLFQFQSTPSARRATPPQVVNVWHTMIFQSTPSARRATCGPVAGKGRTGISIHALREEGDRKKHNI